MPGHVPPRRACTVGQRKRQASKKASHSQPSDELQVYLVEQQVERQVELEDDFQLEIQVEVEFILNFKYFHSRDNLEFQRTSNGVRRSSDSW